MKLRFGTGIIRYNTARDMNKSKDGQRLKLFLGTLPTKIIMDLTGSTPPESITLPILVQSETKKCFALKLVIEEKGINNFIENFEAFQIVNGKQELLAVSRYQKSLVIYGNTNEEFFLRLKNKPLKKFEIYSILSLKIIGGK